MQKIPPISCPVKGRLILAGITLCLLSSCSIITTVQQDSPTWDAAGSGQSFSHRKDIRKSLWQGKGAEKALCGCENGMSRVKVTTKPGDVVLGFLTAGFLVRQRIEWDCAQRSGGSDM